METLKASQCTKDTPIVKPVMSDCGFRNANGVNGLSEIMTRPWRRWVVNGVGLVSYAL